MEEKKLPLLADLRDESTEQVRVVLEPKSRNVEPAVLMETQSSPLPRRTGDISPCFTTSLADTSCSGARLAPKITTYGYGVPGADPYGRTSYSGGGAASEPGGTVRGLW